MPKVTVSFEYDEPTSKWEVYVVHAGLARDAKDAFTAVVITCQQLEAIMQQYAKVNAVGTSAVPDRYQIIPAV